MNDPENGIDGEESRLGNEILLLKAMYLDQFKWDPHTREITFSAADTRRDGSARNDCATGPTLTLRLPDAYLSADELDNDAVRLPTIISACDSAKQDLRTTVADRWRTLRLNGSDEILDQIMVDFQDLVKENDNVQAENLAQDAEDGNRTVLPQATCKTVVIWLHHLLATGKRKLALSPSLVTGKLSTPVTTPGTVQQISGVTKPGYPGIMIFTGPADLVTAHVIELKSQRWQAFQIRFETVCPLGQEWRFEHGHGVKEVESMSEVVAEIQHEEHRQQFLSAIGVK